MPNGAGVDAHAAADPSSPTWTAAAVARRLGIASATLRSWGARYGVGPPSHTAGRYRRYSSVDITELETMLRLHRDGMPMATAAAVARARRPAARPSRELADRASTAVRAEVAALVAAARELDSDSSVRILQHSLGRRGVVATWNDLCRPALTDPDLTPPVPAGEPDAGDDGPDPVACVDAECILVWAIVTSLRRLPPAPPAPPDADPVLLACAAGELHSLGLDVLLAALDERHVPARTLGPSVPTPALLHAAGRSRPAAVFVWAQTSTTADPSVLTALHALTRDVVAVGPGWSGRPLPDGTRTAHSLDEAVACARAQASRPPARSG